MNYFIFILAIFFFQDLPFKAREEFEIKLDYQLKQRPPRDINEVQLNDSRRAFEQRTQSMMLPYVVLNIKLLKLPGSKMRVRISNNRVEKPAFKKIDLNSMLVMDLGFTDDMKDRVTPHEYTLTFVSEEKVPLEVILIKIDEDGSFFVNGEKRGKF
jgi:hypothetical protein